MAKPTQAELEAIRASVAFVGGLSDSLIKFGPFSLGLDGILAWVPGVGELYSTGAAAFLLIQGLRARAPLPVLAGCAALMATRTAVDAVPLAGALAADLFTAHRWSARMIVKAIDKKLGRETAETEARTGRRRRWARFAEQG